jgi:phosphatidylinositol glycan class Z
MFWLPIILLSTAPHQEPRFLLPALVPAVALTAPALCDSRGRGRGRVVAIIAAWIVFNAVGFLLFAVAHQGGVVPATAALSRIYARARDEEGASSMIAVFYRTYPPPRALLVRSFDDDDDDDDDGGGGGGGSTNARTFERWRRRRMDSARYDVFGDADELKGIRVVDLAGADPSALLRALGGDRCAGGAAEPAFVVAPFTAATAATAAWRRARNVAATSASANASACVVALDADRPAFERAAHFSAEEMDAYLDAFATGGARGVWRAARLGVFRARVVELDADDERPIAA